MQGMYETLFELLDYNDNSHFADYKKINKRINTVLERDAAESNKEWLERLEDMLETYSEEFKSMEYNEQYEGTLICKYVKCGKSNCWCNKPGMEHGPYFYTVKRTHEDKDEGLKKTVKHRYIKKNEVDKVFEGYEKNRKYNKAKALINRLNRQVRHLKKIVEEGNEDGQEEKQPAV